MDDGGSTDFDDGPLGFGSYSRKKEDIFRRKWQSLDTSFQRGKVPDFFSAIEIARDGGFSELKKLWYSTRWVHAIFAIAFVFSNVLTLAVNDIPYVTSGLLEHGVKNARTDAHIADIKDDFMVTGFLCDLGAQGFNMLMGTNFRFEHLRLMVIAGIELLLLAIISFRLLWQISTAVCTSDEYSKWSKAARIFFVLVPELSTFSGMRLLHFASPKILSADVSKFLAYSQTRWRAQSNSRCHYFILLARKWTKLVITRLICLLVGMDSFLFRVRLSYDEIHRKEITFWNFLTILMFVRQMIGIVQLGMHVRARIFLFIFGGEDAVMQLEERAVKEVWEAMFVREAWNTFRQARAMALLLSFDEDDFQLMVLEETESVAGDEEGELSQETSETDD